MNKKNIKTYFDIKHKFYEIFDSKTGRYIRSGVLNGEKDTGIDPFMRDFPSLIDVGIMGHCACAEKCNIGCYQNAAANKNAQNMPVELFERLCKESQGRVFSFALGGRGDPDCHEDFEEILKLSNQYGIVPNFTTSGIALTKEKAELCKKYCGAVAVSWHGTEYTYNAIKMLLDAGVKTNIHYVIGNNSIADAAHRLNEDGFPDGINAVVFLLYKPIGLGVESNVLSPNNFNLRWFFQIIDNAKFPFKIGFDSCCCPAVVNQMHNVNMDSMDYCEGARHSMYVDADFNAMPCSFCNQDRRYFVDLHENSIQDAWNSQIFEDFRSHFVASCENCSDKSLCMGGCPVCRQIVLCNRDCKDLK